MYFSFSHSPPSTSYITAPMDIPSSSSRQSQSPSCAYPSWPSRSSLSSSPGCEDEKEAHATSYISDDDLFPCVFDDAAQDCTPPSTPNLSPSPGAQVIVDHAAYMRELIAQHQQAKKQTKRRRSCSSRKSRSGTSKPMSPILEAGE